MNTRAGPLQRFLVTGEPVAIDLVSWLAAGDRSGEYQGKAPTAVPGRRRSRWPSSGGAGQQLVIGQANTRAGPLQPFLVTGATGGHRAGGAGQLQVIGCEYQGRAPAVVPGRRRSRWPSIR
ncbi:hypothetical protein [Aeromonas caviae]|uniref:hypothetical protein n=1 Tax=Aeromonas caviae TaxID=648 RepID=UPI003F796280